MSDLPTGAIAVTGMACRFPGARSVDTFWRNLRDGVESVVSLSEEELVAAGVRPGEFCAEDYVRAAAVLEGAECFDAEFFGFSPKEASIMDPQHRHFLECTWEALESAGYDPHGFSGSIGVFAGCGMQSYFARNLLPNRQLMEESGHFLVRHTGNDKDLLATRVSYELDLRGPSVSVQTACSTSLVAIHLAAQSLLGGECEMAIAGGATIEVPHRQGYVYEEGGILSRDGHCRSFDAASTGTVFGSGIGAVVLRPLRHAVEQGDNIHAVILGSAINNDGARKVNYLAPSVDGQAAVAAEALAVADVSPTSVTFVETHGTGTQIGDPIELKALTEAYGESPGTGTHCALGAVKTNVGHLDTAAGVAGFIKTVLALQHRQLPPTLHFSKPNNKSDWTSTPFYVNRSLKEWVLPDGVASRRAAVNSLGVGGTNAHVILEEPPALASSTDPVAGQLLVWSARSREAAEQQSQNFRELLTERTDINLADAAYTLQLGRHPFAHRRVLAVADSREALEVLKTGDRRRVFDDVAPDQEPALAFMFPGGGAQYPNMGRELYEREPVYRQVVDECLQLLKSGWSVDLKKMMLPEQGDDELATAQLEQPLNSILSIFITEYALARLWMSLGVEPKIMTGHSLGEYTAACVSGVMPLESALAVVVARGRIFEKLPEGAMLSVGLSEDALRPFLGGEESLAAVNAPDLSVVSGPAAAIGLLEERLTAQDLEYQRLRISVAAHSGMLDPYLEEFRGVLDSVLFSPPRIPFVSNLTGAVATSEMVVAPDYWVRHLRQTVRFSEGLATLEELHPSCVLLEVGPSTTLSSLVHQHSTEQAVRVAIPSMRHPRDPGSDVVVLLSALGRLWAAGLPVNWGVLHEGQKRRRVPLPTYPFEQKRYWIDEPVAGTAQDGSIREGLTRRDDVETWLVQPGWEPAQPAGESTKIDADVCVLIRGDASAEGDWALELAEALGVQDTLSLGSEAPTIKDDVSRFVREAFGRSKRGVCFVISDPCQSSVDASSSSPRTPPRLQESFWSLVLVVQCLAEQASLKPCWLRVVTRKAFSVTDELVVTPAARLAAGACRVVRRELPELNCRFIDVPGIPEASGRRIELIRQLVAEIVSAEDESEVTLRGRQRWARRPLPVSWEFQAGGTPLLRRNGVYLITGGLGGLGGALARHLVKKYGARLVLVSRRGTEPDDERPDRKCLLEELDSLTDVFCAEADVTSEESMKSVVQSAERRFGEINGVFHCAGELHDGLLLTKSESEVGRVLDAKVNGAVVLDHLFAQAALDFMVLYSSVSAWVGLPGQVDYAAANEFLEALAERSAQSRAYPVLSVGWGAWREVGIAYRLARDGEPEAALGRHPLLQRARFGQDGIHELLGVLEAETCWMLDGHRTLDGVALLPGTAYVELARVASRAATGEEAISIQDLVLMTPLVVEGVTELRVQLSSDEGDFSVSSRPLVSGAEGEWVEHARGQIRLGQELGVKFEDLAVYRSACGQARDFADGESVTRQGQMLQFGDRWSTLRQAAFGEGIAVADLELPNDFDGDLEQTAMHPALLDVATGFALPLVQGYDVSDSLYVPFAYKRVTVHDSLEASIVSLVRCTDPTDSDTAVFDVTITSPEGRVLVEVEEFVMKRLPLHGLRVSQRRPVRSGEITSVVDMDLKRVAADGIATAEGIRVLECLLRSGCPPNVLVSPYDLTTWIGLLDADVSDGKREERSKADRAKGVVRQMRPSISVPMVLPTNDTERGLASIWGESLGLEEVGIDDNFFELGGHSLGLVQLIMKSRKVLGVDIPVGNPELLGNPTIRVMGQLARTRSRETRTSHTQPIRRVSRELYRRTVS